MKNDMRYESSLLKFFLFSIGTHTHRLTYCSFNKILYALHLQSLLCTYDTCESKIFLFIIRPFYWLCFFKSQSYFFRRYLYKMQIGGSGLTNLTIVPKKGLQNRYEYVLVRADRQDALTIYKCVHIHNDM